MAAHPHLPEPLLAALPPDPYDQLDIARKITSLAVTSRVGKLESEAKSLQRLLAEKELLISGLQERVGELQQSLRNCNSQLAQALEQQSKLSEEKTALAASVKKLTRDVLKLESFKRTLISSLQEEDDNQSQQNDDNKQPSEKSSAVDSSFSSPISYQGGEFKNNHQLFSSTPGNHTPELTPSGSPKRTPMGLPPKGRSTAVSPRQHSMKGSLHCHSGNDARFSLPSSMPTSKHSTAPNSPPKSVSKSARTSRVDGKEFFRQARNRLTYEQFSAFLSNIKDLNAHKQSKEEALEKARGIFGPDNEDLYSLFYGLLHRQLLAQG